MSESSTPLLVKRMRPTKHQYFMEIARVVGSRSTCQRRQVGCVLVDVNDRISATGHNGVPAGMPHCLDHPCPGAGLQSGTGLDACQAIHAEQNALMYAPDPYSIKACYVTASPCITCVKMLLNTSCDVILFDQEYPQPEARKMWVQQRGLFSWMPAHYEPFLAGPGEDRLINSVRAAIVRPAIRQELLLATKPQGFKEAVKYYLDFYQQTNVQPQKDAQP